MYNQDTEVLFPSRVIPTLRTLHHEEWRQLIDRVDSKECTPVERYAFVLMMVRMCGCAGCNADSFRAMRGCTQCSRQTLLRFHGEDVELIEQYQQYMREVSSYLEKGSTAPAASTSADEENTTE